MIKFDWSTYDLERPAIGIQLKLVVNNGYSRVLKAWDAGKYPSYIPSGKYGKYFI